MPIRTARNPAQHLGCGRLARSPAHGVVPVVRFSRLLAALIIVGSLVILAILCPALSPAQALADVLESAGEPWPPFVMVFKEPTGGSGAGGSVDSFQVTRLDYKDRQHWRTVILEHSAFPRTAWMTITLEGNLLSFHNSDVSPPWQDSSRVVPREERMYVPPFGSLRWVPPSPIELQLGKPGYAIKRVGDGLAVLRHTALCSGYLVRTETTFRLDDGIPLRRVRFINGVPTTQFEVLELQIGKAALTLAQKDPQPARW